MFLEVTADRMQSKDPWIESTVLGLPRTECPTPIVWRAPASVTQVAMLALDLVNGGCWWLLFLTCLERFGGRRVNFRDSRRWAGMVPIRAFFSGIVLSLAGDGKTWRHLRGEGRAGGALAPYHRLGARAGRQLAGGHHWASGRGD